MKIKSLISVLLALTLLFVPACTGGEASNDESTPTPTVADTPTAEPTDEPTPTPTEAPTPTPDPLQELKEKNKVFDLGLFTQKLWEGDTVYHEAVGFLQDYDGSIRSGELLYTPDTIVSVRSSKLDVEYVEGVDYVVEGKRIVLTENSSIPVMPSEKYSPFYPDENLDWLMSEIDFYRYIAVDGTVRDYQIDVTYTHSEKWDGFVPQSQIDKLPKTKAKLENNEPLNVVFYGDSITAGWEASGVNEKVLDVNTLKEFTLRSTRTPNCPAWANLVAKQLGVAYNNSNVTYINRGAGGSTSKWGVTNAEQLVVPTAPDLLIIAFGMNQVGQSGSSIASEIEMIIDTVREKYPDCEFVIVSTMEANTECHSFVNHKLAEQEQAYFDLQSALSDYPIAVAPVHSMFHALYDNGKIYMDITGNNLNHPNDFSVRVYAQTILATLGA